MASTVCKSSKRPETACEFFPLPGPLAATTDKQTMLRKRRLIVSFEDSDDMGLTP
jgi:hypothetical protein